MRGSGWATASSASGMGRSGSYSTVMRSSAAVATSSFTAATAATGSPTNRTLSGASACSSWLTGRMPKGIGRSLPVSTALTPASRAALATSTRRIFACGCGLRSSLAYSMRGKNRSSAKIVAPVTFAVASILRSAFPTTRNPAPSDCRTVGLSDRNALSVRLSDCPTVRRLRVAIQCFRRRFRVLAPQARRGQLHGLVDLEVAGAAAEVAGERLLDRSARGAGLDGEQCLGREQERGGAVAALRRAQLGERVLERVQLAARRHAFDGRDAMSGTGKAEQQAGEHGRAVEQDRAGPALAQLTPMLGAREPRVFPQHLEQRFVGCEGERGGLAVQLETDRRFRIGHRTKRNLVLRVARCQLWRPTFRVSMR